MAAPHPARGSATVRRFWLMKHEQRCGRCRRLLLKMEENALRGALEIKCPRCGTITELRPQTSPSPKRLERDEADLECL
ncbi:Com family DNA-binding transcriptional regulator [Tropicibacter sp. Alg240-R139]|uniref:Com family DNA-binding transcriptional regulator n=1 Tax=Tropicibacter sp. Alg240-R139 TaxID=2305991 RepID=UPI0035940286